MLPAPLPGIAGAGGWVPGTPSRGANAPALVVPTTQPPGRGSRARWGHIAGPQAGLPPGTGPGPSWPRVLARAQRRRGCPHSAVAVCDAPHDSPARLSLAAGTQGLQDCMADLLQPFQGDPIDMVAGIDAMGFILGAAAAAALQKGFLAIRKAGHLCVQTLAQPYTDYSGREKVMEVRTDAILPGLRILLVDQWVETGGTMRAAIQLVERLGGVVAGVAAICIEDSEGGRWIRERYKCSHCVPPSLQPRFDRHQFGCD
ncbi:adenine phosphoribosyltransferase-like isoform X3 [Balearica regulorum gibbericeps]|uniref:adenine phosphoribosyltransferase-like isoform X3 n=1 Tax=Balearica regulorum gibbericeps TaxID=100784 RepID=UPI003F6031B2